MKVRALIFSLIGCTLGAFFIVPTFTLQAAGVDELINQACTNRGGTTVSNSAVCNTAGQNAGKNPLLGQDGIITKAIRVISYIVGIAAVIMIIIGGVMYVLSNGDSNKISTAKKTIIYALVGLVIAILAGSIVAFLTGRLL